ncbi:hypothetical protein F4802DRAFT_172381 [Xylaria palmicola]|nr:hypothetical protein F4802DRAFT_172381 [Xylaria palmicola]
MPVAFVSVYRHPGSRTCTCSILSMEGDAIYILVMIRAWDIGSASIPRWLFKQICHCPNAIAVLFLREYRHAYIPWGLCGGEQWRVRGVVQCTTKGSSRLRPSEGYTRAVWKIQHLLRTLCVVRGPRMAGAGSIPLTPRDASGTLEGFDRLAMHCPGRQHTGAPVTRSSCLDGSTVASLSGRGGDESQPLHLQRASRQLFYNSEDVMSKLYITAISPPY